MSDLYIDFTPAYLYTEDGESENITVPNRLAIALRNPSFVDTVILKNQMEQEYSSLPPYDRAQVQEGLSCIYLRFDLGKDSDCLTTEELFSASCFAYPEDWYCCRAYSDTLILYPARDLSLYALEGVEFILDRLRTLLPADTSTICHMKYVNIMGCGIQEGEIILHKKRCPLCIRGFYPASRDVIAGFRDTVHLQWSVTGAERIVLQPGGVNLNGAKDYIITLTGQDRYTLTAYCGDSQVSQSILLEPLPATIEYFKISPSSTSDEDKYLLSWKVINTRHAYISGVGRVEGSIGSHPADKNPQIHPYTLSVENEDGIKSLTVSEISPNN